MNTSELTPEIESHNEDYTEGIVLFTHPFIEDIYARVNVNFDGWRPEQWQYVFDPLWSSYDDFNVKELEKSAKEYWIEKLAEYEEENRERDEYVSDAFEHYMDF